jgi:hypothetical protein
MRTKEFCRPTWRYLFISPKKKIGPELEDLCHNLSYCRAMLPTMGTCRTQKPLLERWRYNLVLLFDSSTTHAMYTVFFYCNLIFVKVLLVSFHTPFRKMRKKLLQAEKRKSLHLSYNCLLKKLFRKKPNFSAVSLRHIIDKELHTLNIEISCIFTRMKARLVWLLRRRSMKHTIRNERSWVS